MSLKWSFSTDRCFRRCQRQFFFRDLAASHSAKDPLRHEAYVRKQLKGVEQWQGLLVHGGIERFVLPCWEKGATIDWAAAVDGTLRLCRLQCEFSKLRKYRDQGVSKGAHGDAYCALQVHDEGGDLAPDELARVERTIHLAFENLSKMSELLDHLARRRRYWSDKDWQRGGIQIAYAGVRIEIRPDLLFFRSFGQPTIVDWKVSESMGGSDALLQTALYAWALCRHAQWKVPRPEDVELIEVQLLEPAVIRYRADEALFEQLEDRVYRSVDEIRALAGDGRYAGQRLREFAYANNPNSCSFCTFRSLCREACDEQPAFEPVRDLQLFPIERLVPAR